MPPQDQELTDEDREAAKLLRRMLQAQAKLDEQAAGKAPAGYELIRETPDGGKIYRRPDGQLTFTSSGYATNNQAEIQRMIQGMAPAQARRTETNKQIVEQDGVRGAAATAIKGLPFIGEYFDEAVGMMTGDPRTTAALRETTNAYQEQRPLESFGLQMGLGTAATLPFIPFQAAGNAIKAAPTMGQAILGGLGIGAAAGAVEGAVSGFGAGEGTAEQRLPSAQTGAVIGGVLGGTLGAAAAPVEMGVRNALQYFGNKPVREFAKQFGISPDAAKVVLASIQEGDLTTAQAALQRAGSSSMLAEMTPATKNLLDAAIALGSGGDKAQQALLARNLRGEQEMRGAFDRFLGKPEDLKDVQGNIRMGTAEERKALYDAAYGKTIDYSTLQGKELQNWLKFVPPEALNYANKIRSMDPNARAPQIEVEEVVDVAPAPAATARAAAPSPAPTAAAPVPKDFNQNFMKEAQRIVDYNGGVDKAIEAQQYVIDQLVKNNAPQDRINRAVSVRFAIQRMAERSNRELDEATMAAGVDALKRQGFNTDKVYYHGGDVEFDTFDMTKAGRREVPWYGRGAYLTPNRDMAKNYAAGGKVMPFYVRGNMLQIRKPEDWPSWLNKEADIPQQLKDRGYVGIDIDIKTQGPKYGPDFKPMVDKDGKLVTQEESMPEVVVFDPANIVRADKPPTGPAPRAAKPIDPNTNYNIDPRGDKFVIRNDAGEEVLGAPEFPDRKQALAWLQAETRKARQAPPVQPAAPAARIANTNLNVEQWDLITRGLNEMAYGSPAGVMGGKSEVQSLAAKNAREIRKLIMEQVPEYRAALGLARDTIEEVKSAEIGFNLLNGGTTVKEVKDMLSSNAPAVTQSMKLGLRSGLDHALGNLKVAAANPNTEIKELMAGLATLRSRNNMSKVRALLGDKDADEFYKILDEQATGIELAAAVAANSKTAQRQAVGRAVEEIAAPGILGTMLRGEPVNASRMVVQSITGKTPEADAARRMGLYDDIAAVLTRVQGQRAQDALNLIQQAKAGKALTDVQAAIVAKAVTAPAAIGAFKAITAGENTKRTRPYQSGMGREATE